MGVGGVWELCLGGCVRGRVGGGFGVRSVYRSEDRESKTEGRRDRGKGKRRLISGD